MWVLLTMSYNNIVLNIIPTLYRGYIASVHRMVMKNRPFDPGSIQGSHRPISFIRIKHRTRANDFFWNWVQYSSQKPYYKWNRVSTSNERVWCTTQLAKLSFNHSIGKSWKTSAVSTTDWCLKLTFASCVVHIVCFIYNMVHVLQ